MTIHRVVMVFVISFTFGFLLGLIVLNTSRKTETVLSDNSRLNVPANCPPHRPTTATYESWVASKGILRTPLDIDEFLYLGRSQRQLTEAEWLRRTVHVTCIVFVEREKNAEAAMHTWLKHCNHHILYHARKPHDLRTSSFHAGLNVVSIEVSSSWHFVCNVIRSLWKERRKTLQWVLFVSDDMFVVPENLRYMVAHLDSNTPYYLGHALSLWGQPYNLALAGYVLSKGSIQLMSENFTSSGACQRGGKYWKKEDFYLGRNLEKLCVMPSDTRDASQKGRFHGYNLNQLLFENKLASIASYWKNSIFPTAQGKMCCSENSVAFQGIEADKIFMYDYIINHLRVFRNGIHGNKPAPTPYPPEYVWQQFLRERGFSSPQNITAEQYLEAWKSKIVEDLTKRGYGRKKHKWRGDSPKNGEGHGDVYAVPIPFQVEDVLGSDYPH